MESDYDLKLLAEHAKSTQFKGRQLIVVGTEHINRLLIYDISPAVREDEIYGMLHDISKGLYGVTLFDTNTPQGILSAGVCLVEYDDYSSARSGMLAIIQRHTELRSVLSPEFKVMWAEPLFDYFAEFALCTRALQVKNLPVTYQFEDLHRAFAKYGSILKIRRYASHALIYYSKPSEARLAFESLASLELPSGVICKLSLARIKLKDTPSAESASPDHSPSADKLYTVNLLELGSSETVGLTHFLLHGSLPEQDLLMSKARTIIKRAAFAHASAHQPPPASKEYMPQEPRYDAVPVVDTTSLQGKRMVAENMEREESSYTYKKPKPDSDVNPFTAQPAMAHYYAPREMASPSPMSSHYMRPQPPMMPPPQPQPHMSSYPSYPQYGAGRYQPAYNHMTSEAPGKARTWESVGYSPASGMGHSGFRQSTMEMLAKMTQQEQIKYLQQCIQQNKLSDPSLLQFLSRLALQQPAKQV